MDRVDFAEGNGAAAIDPISGRASFVIESVLRFACDGAHEGERTLMLAARRVSKLDLVDIPYTPMHDLDGLIDDPHLAAVGYSGLSTTRSTERYASPGRQRPGARRRRR